MTLRSRWAKGLVAVAAGAAIALTVAAPASQAASTSRSSTAPTTRGTDLVKGTWTGTFTGFESGKAIKGLEKFVVTKVNGSTVLGTWQFRPNAKAKWSKAAPLQWVVTTGGSGTYQVTGADANGIYFGNMSGDGTSLNLTYQGSVNNLVAMHFIMKKQ